MDNRCLFMASPPSASSVQSDQSATETTTNVLPGTEGELLELQASSGAHPAGYSLLIRGEIESSDILSAADPEVTVTVLANNTKLVAGTVSGGRVGFLLNGEILAAEFDDPEPTVKIGGAFVDHDHWPTVKSYTGHGPDQEPVRDPFPDGGDMTCPPADPLNPRDYVVELDAADLEGTGAFCFDLDGEVLDHPETVSVSESGDRVYGCVTEGETIEVGVDGLITRIDTARGIHFSVTAGDGRTSPIEE